MKPTPSVSTRRIGVDGDHYKIDLCEKHNEMFDREVGLWTTYGYEDPAYLPSERFITREQVERDRIAATKREVTQPTLTPVPDLTPVVSDTDRLRWALTPHAQERAAERGVSVDEAIFAAAYPEHSQRSSDPMKYGRDAEVRYADDVGVIVDPHRRIVITVLPRRGSVHDDGLNMQQRSSAAGR